MSRSGGSGGRRVVVLVDWRENELDKGNHLVLHERVRDGQKTVGAHTKPDLRMIAGMIRRTQKAHSSKRIDVK